MNIKPVKVITMKQFFCEGIIKLITLPLKIIINKVNNFENGNYSNGDYTSMINVECLRKLSSCKNG